MKFDEQFLHKRHFLNEEEHKQINRYIQVCAQFYNLYIDDDDKVLDVGAADGEFSKYLKGNYFAIDIEPASDTIEIGTIQELDDSIFDVILYNHVLEHIFDTTFELDSINEKLKLNGILIINVPYFTSSWSWDIAGHYALFNEIILDRLLKNSGFEVLEHFRITFREDKEELIMIAKKIMEIN